MSASQVYLRRLLDTLTAGAQVKVESAAFESVWGQFLRDSTGDNIDQYGSHGTAQAVLALAIGFRFLKEDGARYHQHLLAGTRALQRFAKAPLKTTDSLKTFKVAELLGALAAVNGEAETVNDLLAQLVAGFRGTGWSYDVQQVDSDIASLWPTVYVIDALSYLPESRRPRELIVKALDWCLSYFSKTSAPWNDDSAALVKLCECADRYKHESPAFSDALLRIYSGMRQSSITLPLETENRLEYRIRAPAGTGAHAFCTIPTGVAQLRADVWLFRREPSVASRDKLVQRVRAFLTSIRDDSPTILGALRTISYAVRMLAEYSADIEGLVPTTPLATTVSLFEAPVASRHSVSSSGTRAQFSQSERETKYSLGLSKAHGPDFSVRILDELTGGYSGANVDLCEVTRQHGVPELLQVFKLDQADAVDREYKGARDAATLIDKPYRVELYGDGRYHLDVPGYAFLRYSLASSTITPGDLSPFLRFVDEAESEQVESVLQLLLSEGLGRAKTIIGGSRQISLGFLCEAFDGLRSSPPGTFWSDVSKGIAVVLNNTELAYPLSQSHRWILRFPSQTLMSPVSRWPDVSKVYFAGANVANAHGDLNPRNVLVVRRSSPTSATPGYEPVLIDFHRFSGPAPASVDYCRLEAGLHVKALKQYLQRAANDGDLHEQLMRYVDWLTSERGAFFEPKLPIGTSLPLQLQRVGRAALAIRQAFKKNASAVLNDDERLYIGTLMLYLLNYLKATYDAVLVWEQRVFSLYLAGRILEVHFVRPGLRSS
jgi:hypothetical protein